MLHRVTLKLSSALDCDVNILWRYHAVFFQAVGDNSLLPMEEVKHPILNTSIGNPQLMNAVS